MNGSLQLKIAQYEAARTNVDRTYNWLKTMVVHDLDNFTSDIWTQQKQIEIGLRTPSNADEVVTLIDSYLKTADDYCTREMRVTFTKPQK